MTTDAKCWSFSFHTGEDRAEGVIDYGDWPEIFDPPPAVAVSRESDQPGGRVLVEITICGSHPKGEYESALAAVLRDAGAGTPIVKLSEAEDRDWVAESQKGLKPVYAGKFVVHGDHDRNVVEADEVGILIEAGQAFGTGHHQSTQGALAAIDWLGHKATPLKALDIGTGSGILAIAMAKFWPCAVLATDSDPKAVEVAMENVDKNRVPRRKLGERQPGIFVTQANSFEHPGFGFEGPFDLITANILAGPLIDLAPGIAKNLVSGGYVILSGFLESEEAEVFGTYRPYAFRLARHFPLGEWRTLVLQKD